VSRQTQCPGVKLKRLWFGCVFQCSFSVRDSILHVLIRQFSTSRLILLMSSEFDFRKFLILFYISINSFWCFIASIYFTEKLLHRYIFQNLNEIMDIYFRSVRQSVLSPYLFVIRGLIDFLAKDFTIYKAIKT